MSNQRSWKPLVAFALICTAAICVGISLGPGPWYEQLTKPAITPPNWVFSVVWTPLFAMIAVSGWLIWTGRQRYPAAAWWGVQLALNVGWSCLFFGLHLPGWALGEIVVLWATILMTILTAYRAGERLAAWLLVPYLAWVAFATLLNFQFWRLNSW